MPKVFVPNKSIHDFSPALEYGDLVYLTEGNLDRFNTSAMYRRMYDALKDSSPEDYLLVSGLNVLCSVATFILTKLHGRVNFLVFKTKGRKKIYLERTLA